MPGSGNEGSAKGFSARVKGDHQLWGYIWLYGDIEVNRQFYNSQTIDTTLYRYGGEIRFSPKQILYAGMSNKILVSDAVAYFLRDGNTYGSQRDTFDLANVPVLATVDPFFEIGATIEF